MVEISTELIEILTNTAFYDDPLRCLLESMCAKNMDAEVMLQVNARRSERTPDRRQYRSGYRNRDWDTRLGFSRDSHAV